jgi:hypothetical protein
MILYPLKTVLKRLPARFYRSNAGREPVREWLKSLDAADRRVIGEDIKDVEFSWPIGMPLVRSLGRDIWGSEAAYRTDASPACCSASNKNAWCCCTVL